MYLWFYYVSKTSIKGNKQEKESRKKNQGASKIKLEKKKEKMASNLFSHEYTVDKKHAQLISPKLRMSTLLL